MNVMSVTKSVTSLLIGIAIDQGLIKSVDDYVMDYYKETYTPKRGEQTIFKVTIKHLLTMTAPYKGKSEPWTKVCTSDDWTLTTLDVLGGRKGITNEFRYHTLGVQILLGIIRNTSGMNVFVWYAPSYALSRPFTNNYSLSDMAQWLYEILAKEEIYNSIIIGQSMGGYLAQMYMKDLEVVAAEVKHWHGAAYGKRKKIQQIRTMSLSIRK